MFYFLIRPTQQPLLNLFKSFSSPQLYFFSMFLLMTSKYHLAEGLPDKGHVLSHSLIPTASAPTTAGEHTLQLCLITFPFLCRDSLQKSCRKPHYSSSQMVIPMKLKRQKGTLSPWFILSQNSYLNRVIWIMVKHASWSPLTVRATKGIISDEDIGTTEV